jgi:hypothetical protein
MSFAQIPQSAGLRVKPAVTVVVPVRVSRCASTFVCGIAAHADMAPPGCLCDYFIKI